MLIGAHVSPAGGPAKAVARGEERACRAIQIFNQNPRAWKSREYGADEVKAFHAAMEASGVEGMVLPRVFPPNRPSEDDELRSKSVPPLTVGLNPGAQLGGRAGVLPAGLA